MMAVMKEGSHQELERNYYNRWDEIPKIRAGKK